MSATTTSLTLASLTPTGRRRCTGVVATHEAATVDVCLAGSVAALHLYTTSGRIVVVVPIDEIQKLRGPRDSNGVPFRDPATYADAYAADAEAVPLKAASQRAETAAAYAKLWVQLEAKPHQSVDNLAISAGVSSAGFSKWIRTNHPGELKRLRSL
jgi:hypothetical protein